MPYIGALGFVAGAAPLLISTSSSFLLVFISLSIYMWIRAPSCRTALDRMILATQKHTIKLGMFLATNRWWHLGSVDLELPTNTHDEARTVWAIQETTQTFVFFFSMGFTGRIRLPGRIHLLSSRANFWYVGLSKCVADFRVLTTR